MAADSPLQMNREMLSCKLCNIKFVMKHHLQRHSFTFHSESLQWSARRLRMNTRNLFSCPECDVSLLDEAKLKLHLQTHTGSNQYACEECNAMFTTKDCLVSHSALHKVKRFECPACDLDFSLRSSLKHHFKRRHSASEQNEEDGSYFRDLDNVPALPIHRAESGKSESCCGSEYEMENAFRIGHFPTHV